MTTTSTFKQIADELVKRTKTGVAISGLTGGTTSFTLTTTGASMLRGPFTGKKIPIGSPIVITAGGSGVGDDTYVSDWSPSTGVITVSPAVTTGGTDIVLMNKSLIEHGDWITEAVNSAINNRLARWQKTPLTFVPDGDLRGTTVTDYWTAAANGTAAYATAQTFPAGSAADAVGDVGLYRLLQLTTSGGSSNIDGNGIRVQLSAQQRSWYFLTAIRLVSGSGTVTFSVRDNTNSADISLQVSRGNDSQTLTTTTLGNFMVCEGTFQLPATCAEIAPRLACSATGMVAQMTPLIMQPLLANSFPLPNRIEAEDFIGNFYYGYPRVSPGGMEHVSFSEPITTNGLTHTFNNNGDHRTVSFNFVPRRGIWYDEQVSEGAVSSLTDTTTFPLEHVTRWAAFELYDLMMRDEGVRMYRSADGPKPQVWTKYRNAALRAAQNSVFEPRMMQVVGRV